MNFHYTAVLLDQFYGIEMNDEDLEEIGLMGWTLIGNKNTRLYKYSTCLNSDNSVKLPCNISSIEAVTSSYEDWANTTNYSEYGDERTAFVENLIEAEKIHSSPYYISGKMIKYELVGDTLYFNRNYGKVNILYKGTLVDEEGLPELTDKEAMAIATYIAYVIKYKEGLINNNPQIIQLSETLKTKWLQQCDQARVTSLSQNDMNNILDIKGSWDRHCYNLSTKFIK